MTDKNIDYKTLSAELDAVLEGLQSSDLDVDKAVSLFERGMELTKILEEYLKNAENKVKKVKSEWEEKGKA